MNYPFISLVIQEKFEPPTHGLEVLNSYLYTLYILFSVYTKYKYSIS